MAADATDYDIGHLIKADRNTYSLEWSEPEPAAYNTPRISFEELGRYLEILCLPNRRMLVTVSIVDAARGIAVDVDDPEIRAAYDRLLLRMQRRFEMYVVWLYNRRRKSALDLVQAQARARDGANETPASPWLSPHGQISQPGSAYSNPFATSSSGQHSNFTGGSHGGRGGRGGRGGYSGGFSKRRHETMDHEEDKKQTEDVKKRSKTRDDSPPESDPIKQELADTRRELADQAKSLADQQRALAQMKKDMTQAEMVKDLERDNKDRERDIKDKDRDIQEREREIADLKEKYAEELALHEKISSLDKMQAIGQVSVQRDISERRFETRVLRQETALGLARQDHAIQSTSASLQLAQKEQALVDRERDHERNLKILQANANPD